MVATNKQQLAEQIPQNQICWTDEKGVYLVPSATYDKKYAVKTTGHQWTCTCLNFQYRKGQCKHIIALKSWLNKVNEIKHIEKPLKRQLCPFCQSNNFTKNGKRVIKLGRKQRFLCLNCKHYFVEGVIKGIKGNEELVTKTMDLFYKGLSLRKIQDFYRQFQGIDVSYATLYRWIMKYQKTMIAYVNRIYPEVSQTWHADEQYVKAKGEYVYCWNLIDRDSRFLIASHITKGRYSKDARILFKQAKKITRTRPEYIISDGLASYNDAIKKELHSHRIPKIKHLPMAGIAKKHNNNLIERYHNSFRSRDKTIRGFHNSRSAQKFVDGHRLYYNFIRPHQALGNVTPAQAVGLDIGFSQNRWEEILEDSMEATRNKQYPRKPYGKKANSYTIKVWDKDGKPVEKRKLKTEFQSFEKAKEFLRFYELIYPNLVFFVERK